MEDNDLSPAPNGSPPSPDYVLLAVGIVLLLIPLVFMVMIPTSYEKAEFYLRVITALGGALVGASLPGILHVNLPFARAGGALAVFLLIYAVNPPQITIKKLSSLAEESPIETPSENLTYDSTELVTPDAGSSYKLAAEPAIDKPLKKGWAYLGHRPDGEWQYRTIQIDDKAELMPDKQYVVTKKINVRVNAPRFSITGYKFGDINGSLVPNQVIKITSNIDEVGFSKVWAEIEYIQQ